MRNNEVFIFVVKKYPSEIKKLKNSFRLSSLLNDKFHVYEKHITKEM